MAEQRHVGVAADARVAREGLPVERAHQKLDAQTQKDVHRHAAEERIHGVVGGLLLARGLGGAVQVGHGGAHCDHRERDDGLRNAQEAGHHGGGVDQQRGQNADDQERHDQREPAAEQQGGGREGENQLPRKHHVVSDAVGSVGVLARLRRAAAMESLEKLVGPLVPAGQNPARVATTHHQTPNKTVLRTPQNRVGIRKHIHRHHVRILTTIMLVAECGPFQVVVVAGQQLDVVHDQVEVVRHMIERVSRDHGKRQRRNRLPLFKPDLSFHDGSIVNVRQRRRFLRVVVDHAFPRVSVHAQCVGGDFLFVLAARDVGLLVAEQDFAAARLVLLLGDHVDAADRV
mmetsp:Transcript_3160/g.7393  ORF Transcript_3160/g.7393 Transcript_3160/m.7393 type:complete len:344 (+) Transcript_3160:1238-2269(+)